jgi:hypothetical protein
MEIPTPTEKPAKVWNHIKQEWWATPRTGKSLWKDEFGAQQAIRYHTTGSNRMINPNLEVVTFSLQPIN